MSTPSPSTPAQHVPLAQAIFADTSFLLSLIGISQDAKHPALSTQQTRALVRLNELRLANIDGDGDACCYWSPMVFNEVLHTAARALSRDKKFQNEYEQYRQREAPDFKMAAMLDTLHSDEGYQHRHRIPPWFTAALLPYVQMKLRDFQKHLRTTDEQWEAKGITLMDVMHWGTLDPADCVIAIAAANSQASLLLTYDEHFVNTKQHLKDQLGLDVIHD
jgi:predicted nucleic acid-binding protein